VAPGVPTERLVAWVTHEHGMGLDELEGTNVYNFQGEFIAEVEGLLQDRNGQRSHMILSHGGFWDIGDKEVAVPVDKFHFDPEDEVLYLAMSEDELEAAPDYEQQDGQWRRVENDRYYEDLEQTRATRGTGQPGGQTGQ
jgi:sporulation protein YlmC with PRC-barrel domain